MIFKPGDFFKDRGIQYRVLSGTRCAGDMIIEFRTGDDNRWVRPRMSHNFILCGFKWQVEENNYGINGKVKAGKGGRYFLDAIERACINGWKDEAEKVNRQAQNAANRTNGLLSFGT